MTINLNSKVWLKNYNSMEIRMGKRLIPGKTRNSKGKKVSRRPIRAKNVIFDEDTRKWYKKND